MVYIMLISFVDVWCHVTYVLHSVIISNISYTALHVKFNVQYLTWSMKHIVYKTVEFSLTKGLSFWGRPPMSTCPHSCQKLATHPTWKYRCQSTLPVSLGANRSPGVQYRICRTSKLAQVQTFVKHNSLPDIRRQSLLWIWILVKPGGLQQVNVKILPATIWEFAPLDMFGIWKDMKGYDRISISFGDLFQHILNRYPPKVSTRYPGISINIQVGYSS